MRKAFKEPQFKRWHKYRSQKIQRNKNKVRKGHSLQKKRDFARHIIPQPISPPADFRLMVNTEPCLAFFKELRDSSTVGVYGYRKFKILNIKHIQQVDYAAISVLIAIQDDLRDANITVRGDMPFNTDCYNFLVGAGYLDNLYDGNGRRFPRSPTSELIVFEKGDLKLEYAEMKNITSVVKKVVHHLTGTENYCQAVKTIILEMCANSIEWSGTTNKRWLFGVHLCESKVVFTVTDVGQGILATLNREFAKKLEDWIFKDQAQILMGAFDRKYGSSTKEANRNKGLPSIKANFETGKISNLKVLTNNVLLQFESTTDYKIFKNNKFRGTLYQWEMTKECLQ
jgi:hypothetical protein